VKQEESNESSLRFNLLNAELNPICRLLALLVGATIVVVSRLRVNGSKINSKNVFVKFVFVRL